MACSICEEDNNQQSIVYIEQWESKEALQQHIKSSIYSMVINAMELASKAPEINFYDVSEKMGIELIETMRQKGEKTGMPLEGRICNQIKPQQRKRG